MTPPITLWRNARLATMVPGTPWGWVPDGALLVEGETLRWVGPEAELPRELARLATHDESLGGALVTPGLIDCHTHLVYGGHRAHEFEQRLQGASYDEIARASGQPLGTVRSRIFYGKQALRKLLE